MSNEKIKISGVAVREGTSRNQRKYRAKELEKFAPTLIGRPILKDHEGMTDNVIGKITHAESLEEGKTVMYEGWIKEDGSGIIEKMKDGRITEVSIGAMAKKIVREKDNDDVIIPIDMEALELSTTPVPGNRGTSVTISNQEKCKIDMTEAGIKKMIEDYDNSNSNSLSQNSENYTKRKEDKNMETNKLNKIEFAESKEYSEMKDKIEAFESKIEVLTKEKSDVEALRKSDAIARYEEKAKVKGMKVQNLSEATMETINMAIAMVEAVEVKEEVEEDDKEESKEEPKEEPKEEDKEESKEEEKPEAEVKSQEPEEKEEKEEESFKGYVVEQSNSIHGVSFYKHY